MVEVTKADREAIPQDILLSIPKYLHGSLFKRLAAHRQQTVDEVVAWAEAEYAKRLPTWEANEKRNREAGLRSGLQLGFHPAAYAEFARAIASGAFRKDGE